MVKYSLSSENFFLENTKHYTDMAKISNRQIKAWERFNEDLKAFALESEGSEDVAVTLYEDALTMRNVSDFMITKGGQLMWIEDGKQESETISDDEDSKDWLSFWRGCLRRAKRYWSMDSIELDRLHDCENDK